MTATELIQNKVLIGKSLSLIDAHQQITDTNVKVKFESITLNWFLLVLRIVFIVQSLSMLAHSSIIHWFQIFIFSLANWAFKLWIDWFHNQCKWIFFFIPSLVVSPFFEKWYNRSINLKHVFSLLFSLLILTVWFPVHQHTPNAYQQKIDFRSPMNLFTLWTGEAKNECPSEMRTLIWFDKFRIRLEFFKNHRKLLHPTKKSDSIWIGMMLFLPECICPSFSLSVCFFCYVTKYLVTFLRMRSHAVHCLKLVFDFKHFFFFFCWSTDFPVRHRNH